MTTPLAVCIGGVRAGLLHPRREGSYFELDDDYLELAGRPVLGQFFEDNPRHPQRTRQGVPAWFANLLPEGPLRHLIAEKAEVNERRSFFLLHLLGGDLPGAVRIRALDEEALEGDEVTAADLEPDAPLRFSLAGVQMKFSATREDRGLTIPVQGLGGDWIVKLPDERFDGVPENEYAMMELARECGIEVPETQLVSVAEIDGLPAEVEEISGHALAVRRFDRIAGGRVHIEDFAQVLNRWPHEKYGATNFETIARVIDAVCGVDDVEEFLRRLVLTIGIGNYDAHIKNWSLIYRDGRSARLSPAYDIVAVSAYESSERRLARKLALNLGGTRTPEDLSAETFQRFAERSGLDVERTLHVVGDAAQAIPAAWAGLKRRLPEDRLHPSLIAVVDERLERLPLFR